MDSNNLIQRVDTGLIVVGGGIAGLGIAVEAARQGIKVTLLERGNELANQTSANSLRIIHGGFRYLQSLNIPRVLTSMQAQFNLVQKYPDNFTALPCLMVLNKFGLKSKYPVRAATALFGWLARGLKWPPADRLPCVIENFKDSTLLLNQFGSTHVPPVLQWWDWQLNCHKVLVSALAEEFVGLGGIVRLQAAATAITSSDTKATVMLADGSSLSADIVVDSRGSNVGFSKKVKSWTTAFNLKLDAPLDSKYGIGFAAGKRLLFAVPRSANAGAIGTWYLSGAAGRVLKPQVSEENVIRAIKDVNEALPHVKLTRDRVVGIEAGILPCVSLPNEEPRLLEATSEISVIGRVISVVSTKYTTFETQARWVVQLVLEGARGVARSAGRRPAG